MSDKPIDNWREEKQSAWLYRKIATAEPDSARSHLFLDLATAADEQAGEWERRVRDNGERVPEFEPGTRARITAWLARRLGPQNLRPVLAAMKIRGLSVYDYHRPPSKHPMPTRVEQIGRRHRVHGGGQLRAAVFGINDGLVSNLSLIMGVAGASVDTGVVLTTGVAGLLAGALSMAAGEYVSMRSQREMFEYQIGLEREELAAYPREEAEELALIYQARGMDADTARDAADTLIRSPQQALDALAREELGLNPDELGSPWGAAGFSFVSFAIGALVPLLPFLIHMQSPHGVIAAGGLAAAALAGVGALISLFTGRSALWSAFRMVLIGAGAATVTYGIGHILGASLA